MRRVKDFIKKLDQKSFKVLPRLKRAILRIYPVKYYMEKCNYYLDHNESDKALLILDKGLKHYPNSYYLNSLKATIKMNQDNNQDAAKYWERVLKKHENRAMEDDFIKAAQNLLALNENTKALMIQEKGLEYYPNSIELLTMASEQYAYSNHWGNLMETMKKLFLQDDYNPEVEDYISLSNSYYKNGIGYKAEYVALSGIRAYKNNLKMYIYCIELFIDLKKWKRASEFIKYVSKNFDVHYSDRQKQLYGMIHQLIGENETADELYAGILHYNSPKDTDEIGHQEIVIFDNGETRITFYKRNIKTSKVVITFDSLNMTWDKPSFGFKLLSEQDVDIVAVQKQKPKSYHQDLSLESFLGTVQELVNGYETRISYGFSLGAYLAIYYTGDLNCTILSLAPRLSIHPVYGKAAEIGKAPFNHNLWLNSNPNSQPIIVYDPKDKIDYRFVHNEILKAYPHATLVKIPYGGHSMAPHLLRMGLLKEFILTVIHDDAIPVYDRKRKVYSANYYRLLGRECFRRNKIDWARKLSDRAYELLPEDPIVVKLKVDVLKKLGNYKKAEEYMIKAIESKPKRLSYRMDLIDIYILQGNLLKAEEVLEESIEKFGNKKPITARSNKIEAKYRHLVKKYNLNEI